MSLIFDPALLSDEESIKKYGVKPLNAKINGMPVKVILVTEKGHYVGEPPDSPIQTPQ